MNKKSQKLQTRDFISVGIFSLIYAAVAFIIGGIAQMTPITFPFMPMIVALFTGTVFMLYIAKIPKRGAITILGIIQVFFYLSPGCSGDVSIFCGVGYYRRFHLRIRWYLNPLKRIWRPIVYLRCLLWEPMSQWQLCRHSLMSL